MYLNYQTGIDGHTPSLSRFSTMVSDGISCYATIMELLASKRILRVTTLAVKWFLPSTAEL